MSFLTDKKNKCESLALEAARVGRFDEAYRNAADAARCVIGLAEASDGAIRAAYLQDADGWIRLVERLREKASGRALCEASKVDASNADGKTDTGESVSKWLVTERPKERLKDVVGLDEVKRLVADVVNEIKFADYYRKMKIKFGEGALMYGPPGNGKTLLARAIAGELDAAFFNVSGALIKDKYVGQTEKNMRQLFEDAAKFPRAVVFIDEVHSLLTRRGSEKANAIDEFLVATDGFVQSENSLLLLGATNRPQMLDQAAFRRFRNLIYVGLPDETACRKIFELQFQDIPYPVALDYDVCARLAFERGYSGADIERVSTATKKESIRKMIESGANEPMVGMDDVRAMIEQTNATVSQESIRAYREWLRTFTGEGGDASFEDDE